MTRYFTSWLTEQVKLPQSTADNLFAVVIIGLVLGSLVGGIASDWAERRFSSKGRILASQFSLLALVPAMLGFVFLARNPVEVVGCAFVIAFLLHLTYPKEYRRLRQQMVQRRDLLANTETDGPGPVL